MSKLNNYTKSTSSTSTPEEIVKIKQLINSFENKSNINIKDKNGNTALFYAVNNSNIKMVKLLLKNEANVNAKDKSGSTILDYAFFSSNVHN